MSFLLVALSFGALPGYRLWPAREKRWQGKNTNEPFVNDEHRFGGLLLLRKHCIYLGLKWPHYTSCDTGPQGRTDYPHERI
jgi:hypothetical protein